MAYKACAIIMALFMPIVLIIVFALGVQKIEIQTDIDEIWIRRGGSFFEDKEYMREAKHRRRRGPPTGQTLLVTTATPRNGGNMASQRNLLELHKRVKEMTSTQIPLSGNVGQANLRIDPLLDGGVTFSELCEAHLKLPNYVISAECIQKCDHFCSPHQGQLTCSSDSPTTGMCSQCKDQLSAYWDKLQKLPKPVISYHDACHNMGGIYEFPCMRFTPLDCFAEGDYADPFNFKENVAKTDPTLPFCHKNKAGLNTNGKAWKRSLVDLNDTDILKIMTRECTQWDCATHGVALADKQLTLGVATDPPLSEFPYFMATVPGSADPGQCFPKKTVSAEVRCCSSTSCEPVCDLGLTSYLIAAETCAMKGMKLCSRGQLAKMTTSTTVGTCGVDSCGMTPNPVWTGEECGSFNSIASLENVFIFVSPAEIMERVASKKRPEIWGGPINITEDQAKDVLREMKKTFEKVYSRDWDGESEPVEFTAFSDDGFVDGTFARYLKDVTGTAFRQAGIFYVVITLMSTLFFVDLFNPLTQSRSVLAFFGALQVILGMAAAIGFTALIGIKISIATSYTMPFILVGILCDDMYMLALSLDLEVRVSTPEQRWLNAMRSVGLPIFVTSAVNFGVFFTLWAASDLPAVYDIGTTGMIATGILFLTLITSFSMLVYFDLLRRTAGRYECCCCIKRAGGNSGSATSLQARSKSGIFKKKEELSIVFERVYQPLLRSLVVRILVILVTLVVLVVGCLGITNIEVGLDIDDMFSTEMQAGQWARTRLKYFPVWQGVLHWGELDYSDHMVQFKMIQQWEQLEQNRYIHTTGPSRRVWVAHLGWWAMRSAENYNCTDTQACDPPCWEYGPKTPTLVPAPSCPPTPPPPPTPNPPASGSICPWKTYRRLGDSDGDTEGAEARRLGHTKWIKGLERTRVLCKGKWMVNTMKLKLKDSVDEKGWGQEGYCYPYAPDGVKSMIKTGVNSLPMPPKCDNPWGCCPVLDIPEMSPGVRNQTHFALCLKRWENDGGAGSTWPGINFDKDGYPEMPIKITSAGSNDLFTVNLYKTEDYTNMLKQTRVFTDDNPELHSWMSGIAYDYWEQYLTIEEFVLQIGALACGAGFVLCFLFIFFELTVNKFGTCCQRLVSTLIGSLLIAMVMAASMVTVMGMCAHCKVKLSGLSALSCLLSCGFAIEYAVHVVHHFLEAQADSSVERAVHTMKFLFVPTAMSFFSSAVSVIPLGLSGIDFVTRCFFIPLIFVVTVTYFYGAISLPFFLSLLGFMPVLKNEDEVFTQSRPSQAGQEMPKMEEANQEPEEAMEKAEPQEVAAPVEPPVEPAPVEPVVIGGSASDSAKEIGGSTRTYI